MASPKISPKLPLPKLKTMRAFSKWEAISSKKSNKSGKATLGKPGEAGRGKIRSKTIELSNVDIADELIALMKSQRNFSANAKTLRATDQMLKEVLDIKR